MTQVIIQDIIPRTQLVATSGQTVFNTNWTADVATDILVYARATGIEPNDQTQLVSSSNYNVTFIGGSQTVRVTFLSGRTLGDIVTIVRDTPADRLNLYINTNFTPSMLNQDFGILTLVDQQAQMYDYVVNPGYNVSATIEPIVDTVLPILGANQIWAMNAARTAIIPYDIPAGGGIAPSDATYLIKTSDADLPNAQVMGALASGLVVNTTTTGVQLTRVLTPVTDQIAISNADGIAGNPLIGIANNAIFPGNAGIGVPVGNTSQRPVSPTSISLRFNIDLLVLEYWDASAWVQISDTDGVLTVQGTANQVLVNGTTGIPNDGAIVLTLPQDIATTSDVIFNTLQLNGDQILDVNGNLVLNLVPFTSGIPVNFISIANDETGQPPAIQALGADTDILLALASKGDAGILLSTQAIVSPAIVVFSGTTGQHTTNFFMSDTAQSRNVTFPDASGTLLMTGVAINSVPSITFSTTSGIIGTTTNDNAAAGSVGEEMESIVPNNTVSLTTNTDTDITSLLLTAGDWDVWGNIVFTGDAGTGVAVNTGWISTASATLPSSTLYASVFFSNTAAALPYSVTPTSFNVPGRRITVATTQTIYLSGRSTFITSTSTAGGALYARRRR